jgi:dTMP kinase
LPDARKLPRSLGKLIAIEGIDQSGKRTQTHLMARKLRARGHPFSIYDFPDYRTLLGRQLRAYLSGKNQLDFRAVHLLYAANKWERAAEITTRIRRGRMVLVNRYSPSNLAYGVAHGLPLKWLYSLEKDLPKPDIVFVLDVSPRISFARKKRRRDVHETNLAYLRKVRSAYLRLARKFSWKIVDGKRDETSVHLDLWRQVSRFL